jgi:HAMP domain-containing protein
MTKFLNKLEVKLTASFIILIMAISGLTFFYTFSETKTALKNILQAELKAVACVVSSQINADAFAKIKPGDEKTRNFLAIRDALYAAQKSNPDIKYIYTFRANNEKTVKFVVDAEYGISKDAAKVDEVYDDSNHFMIDGLSAAKAEEEVSSDKWGTFLSGYAPIKDSKGKSVGAVGVDMLSKTVAEKEKFIGFTLLIIFIIAVLIAGLIILYFSGTIIRDVKKLNKVANDISTGSMDVHMDVKRNDEIGELAESFGRMVASLKIMMMDDKKKK